MRILRLVILIGCLTLMGAQSNPPIKIAAVLAMTGEAAPDDAELFKSIRLAVDELNVKGGLIGHKINLIEIDNECTALGSKKAAEKAVQEGVMAVIGATWSAHSLAMAPVLQNARIPMITPYSTNPDVTLVGDYIFRVCYVDDFQGKVMANFARRDLKAEQAVVLTNSGSTFSLGLAKMFKENFIRDGGEVLDDISYLTDSTDFNAMLAQVKDKHPDVIFLPGYTKDSAYIIKAARKAGIKAIFLGSDAWSQRMYTYGGSALDGSYYSDHWHTGMQDAKSTQFLRDYTQHFGKFSVRTTPLGYDAVMVLADAVARAGSLDSAKIRSALAATKGFKGVTGTITFDQNRNPVGKSAVILKLEHGQSVFIKSIKP